MTPMFLEVTEQLGVQSSPVPMQDRVHHQNQLTVIVQENITMMVHEMILIIDILIFSWTDL